MMGKPMLRDVYQTIRLSLYNFKYRERKSIGFNSNKEHFFIVRRKSEKTGICSDMMIYLEKLNYMEKKYPHAVPVVDMENYANALLPLEEVGTHNAWDDLFKPFSKSLEEAYGSGNYILSSATVHPQEKLITDASLLMNPDEEFWKWSDLFHKYFAFNAQTKQFFQKLERDKLSGNNRCLGVLCRGTDYTRLRPAGHPIQPDVEQVIQKCKEVQSKQNYNCIVLATEDEGIAEAFVHAFGEKCVLTRDKFISYSGGYVADSIVNRLENSRQYLGQLYLLSRCQGLISGVTSASPFVLFMADDKPFEYTYFWDLGRY